MRAIMSSIITLLFLFSINIGCSNAEAPAENKKLSDKEIVAGALKGPERHFENFRFNPDLEFHQRVTDPPSFIVNYIRELDQKDYTSYKITKEELKTVERSVKQLPQLLKRMLKEKSNRSLFYKRFYGKRHD